MSVQLIALLTNIALAALKFTVGSIANSRALIADAFNSAGDVLATFVAWLAFRYGKKPPDDDHNYGHQNAETLAGLLLGGMLCATGAFICIQGILGILDEDVVVVPGQLALWAALITAAVKEILYHASMRAAKRNNSPTLLASARDHRADVVSGLVALVGIYVARNGYPEFDAIAGVAIGCYILFLGWQPVRDNTAILMHAAPPKLGERASEIAAATDGVLRIARVRVQPLGGQYRMDMSVEVRSSLSVELAHQIAHRVEDAVRGQMDEITEVYVHVEPDSGG